MYLPRLDHQHFVMLRCKRLCCVCWSCVSVDEPDDDGGGGGGGGDGDDAFN